VAKSAEKDIAASDNLVDNMKVALITHEGGGIASVSYGLARSLAKKEVDTTIFTEATISTPPGTERQSNYLQIVRLPTIRFPPRSIWFQALSYQKLSKMLKEYDVIHGVSPEASFMFAILRRKLNKPFIGTIHTSPRVIQRIFLNQPFSSWTLSDLGYHVVEFPFHDFSISRILADSDHTTFCSWSVFEECKAYGTLGFKKTSVIYNGIDLGEIESIPDLPSSKNVSENRLSIMFAGRLFWFKGVTFLLEAFREVRKNFPNVYLKIFGRGPLQGRVKKFISESGLEGHADYLGYVDRKSMLSELKKSDIVCYPSLYEAQPIFALEAMTCGKPVLMFDFPFAREIISNMNNGLLAKPSNVTDLSEKMQMLLSDSDLRQRLGENALISARNKHNWDVQSEEYLKIYERYAQR
jgi:1,4-alpha-glucan branching enzyme